MKTIPFLFLLEIFSLCKDHLFPSFLTLFCPSSSFPFLLHLPSPPFSFSCPSPLLLTFFTTFPFSLPLSPPLLSFTSLLLHFLLLIPSSTLPISPYYSPFLLIYFLFPPSLFLPFSPSLPSPLPFFLSPSSSLRLFDI